METRTILNKIKATLVDEIKAMVKIPESIQKVLDAYLIVLGFRTTKARKQAMKEFKERTLDLLKAAKTVKPSSLTFSDCKMILDLTAELDSIKISKINLVCEEFLKWIINIVQLRIAEARFPEAIKESSYLEKEETKTPLKRPITASVKKRRNPDDLLIKPVSI